MQAFLLEQVPMQAHLSGHAARAQRTHNGESTSPALCSAPSTGPTSAVCTAGIPKLKQVASSWCHQQTRKLTQAISNVHSGDFIRRPTTFNQGDFHTPCRLEEVGRPPPPEGVRPEVQAIKVETTKVHVKVIPKGLRGIFPELMFKRLLALQHVNCSMDHHV